MDDDDFGYEIGQDDLRERSKQYRNYDDFGYEIGYEFSRKSSKQYYRTDDESEECKLLRETLNKLDCKLRLLKSVEWTKPNATVFDAAESMKEMLDEILKMKDTTHQEREEENVKTMIDVETEKDAVEKNLKDDEQKIDESFKELQLNSVEELKEGKVEVDAVADLKRGIGGELR